MLSLVSQYVEIFNDDGSLVEGLHMQRVHPNDKSIVSCEGCTEAVAPSKGHVPGKLIGVQIASSVHLRRLATILTRRLEVQHGLFTCTQADEFVV